MGKLIGVDPGIRGTGVALFDREDKYPIATVSLEPEPTDPWDKRAYHIVTSFETFVLKHRPVECYIEQPVFFFQTQRGLQAAHSGDLVKLSMLAGMLFWVALYNNIEVYTVEPVEWKGRSNKEKSHTLIHKTLPYLHQAPGIKRKLSEHEMDAIGLALYGKGIIKRGNRRGRL